jgi:hypothetical protein
MRKGGRVVDSLWRREEGDTLAEDNEEEEEDNEEEEEEEEEEKEGDRGGEVETAAAQACRRCDPAAGGIRN